MGGGCLRERVCTAVGWLRVAEWCWLGLLRLVLGVGLRQAWERLAWAAEASAGLRRVCGLRTRLTWCFGSSGLRMLLAKLLRTTSQQAI